MSTALTLSVRATMLDGFETFMATGAGTATLVLYQGVIALASFSLSNTPFSSAVRDSIILASTPILNSGTAVAGTVNRAIISNRNAAAAATWTVSTVGGGGDIQVPSVTITAAASQRLNSLVLRMSATGLLTPEGSLALQ